MAIELTEQQLNSKMLQEKIITVADKLFHQYSYEKVSMREIAAAAGVTTGALYHHFGGKEELLMATFRRNLGAETLWEQYRVTQTPLEDMHDFLCTRMVKTVLADGVELTRYRIFSVTRFDRQSVLERCVYTLVARAMDQGLLTRELTIEEISDFICAMYRSTIYQYSISKSPVDLTELLDKRYRISLRAILKKED